MIQIPKMNPEGFEIAAKVWNDRYVELSKIVAADQDGCDCQVSLGDATHWRPIINPPLGQLPAPLEALVAVLRRVKGVG